PVFSGREPTFDAAALRLPENAAPLMGDGSDHMVRELSLYENEIELATGDDGASPLLWLEAGRLTEKLGDPGRARVLYGEALARDPDLAPATRALRRIACALGDTDTAMDHLEREIAVGDAAERRALGAYRAELLLSLGDLSAASSAISALVEEGPGDIRALMAKAELSARLGDPVMLSDTLIDLETVLADRSLAAAAFSAGGLLATVARAGTGENGQATPLAGLAADAVATAEPALAAMVELFSGQASGDPEAAEAAFARAAKLLPDSPRVLTRLAETRAQAGQPGEAANALATVLSGDGPRRERIRAGIDAGRLFITAGDADRGKDTLIATLALDPDNAALAAEIAAQVASDPAATADLLAARKSSGSVFDRIAYARALATAGDSDGASAELNAIHDPPGGAVARALDEVHVQSGMWGARSAVWEAVAMAEGTEMAWQRAARASEAWALANGDATAVSRAITAYGRVAELCPQSVEAHCALLRLASMAGPELSLQALAAAEGAAPKVIRSGTMALRRAAAALVGDDPDVATAEEVLRQALAESPRDPRPATALWVLLAGFGRMDDAAAVMIERAEQVAPSPAATRLKYRAASILLEASDETARARALFDEVVAEAPDLLPAHELRRVAYRRLGDPVPATAAQAGAGRGRDTRATAAPGDAFTSLVREAETCEDVLADRRRAAALYARALALSPGNPLAADGFVRAAEAIGDTSALAELALANLRRAEDAGDGTAKADAYEELARIDAELRGDAGSALLAFESAAASEPGRALALRAMERACAEDGRLMDLAAVYERQVAGLADSGSADRVALLLERALLGLAHNAPRAEVTAAFREALAHEPEIRLALFHLESWAREQPPSQAHLELCDAIAEHFATDSRAHAGFLTRAAEIALALGDVPGAIARYRAAVAALGSYDAALSGWQRIALLEQRWSEAADAALAHADGSVRDSERARLYHLAGVLLMERAGDPERAIAALRKALAADPAHRDAFARLRALYIAADMSVDLSHLYYHRLEVTDDDGE
ncbi:MAG TPA: tetratricopeptide repeat protein, partial [Kofleriaceae bacterium]|nr:tetratricopeptide repeat protein [Kofleriaceae bacterium]